MKAMFNAANPRQKARPLIDEVLERGVDQVALACAFLTGGGAAILKKHAARLRLPGSFLVVAWERPTTLFLDALEELHSLFPGNLYVHLGAQTPVEKHVGRGLMHSKVFLARAGDQCWLWTGSHNMTASATQGVNCEAAIVLEGSMSEPVFKDALSHLERCRQEAIVYDPYHPPPIPPSQQTLVIHVECHVALKPSPWFVHLMSPTTAYDKIMTPPASVWLYVYSPGTLASRSPRPTALAAYSGTLTALNFTERHPQRGIVADWQRADYVIDQNHGVFHLTAPKPHATGSTQCIFRVEVEEDPSTVWLTGSPTPKLELIAGDTWVSELDPEFREFFTPRSLRGGSLVHRDYHDMQPRYRVLRKEIGPVDAGSLEERLPGIADAKIEVEEARDVEDQFAFIYRAKYRI